MDISRVKYKLNQAVRLVNQRHDLDAEYLLTGCILRRRENGIYYQAELKDIKANSIVIADLADVCDERIEERRNAVNKRKYE